MSERNEIQLAIGYGLGAGLVLAGIVISASQLVLSFLEVSISVYILTGMVLVGGVAIAVYNALHMKRETVQGDPDSTE